MVDSSVQVEVVKEEVVEAQGVAEQVQGEVNPGTEPVVESAVVVVLAGRVEPGSEV